MNRSLDRRFPSVADIEKAALRRLPRFIGDYIRCGIGRGGGVRRNREALEAIELQPRYAIDAGHIDTSTTLCGRGYEAPFAVAPVGLGGIAWPGASEALAVAAAHHRIPFTTATYGLSSLERLRAIGGDYTWFQLYRPNLPDVETDLVDRARAAGYEVLVVTVDVPTPTRRDHDIRNGFSIPPGFDLSTLIDILSHPRWALAYAAHTWRHGRPGFENVARYAPAGVGTAESMQFIGSLTVGHITPEIIATLRRSWSGTLMVKGVLDPADAIAYRNAGADAIVVSNHGGRQLEAAPASATMLPLVRAALGEDFPLLVDGGVRTGLDICRMLALGADFVLLGRPFYYAVAAMGLAGADHVMRLLKAEFAATMGQLGCTSIADLPGRLR